MRLKRTRQRGAADLIAIAVSMAILSIVVAGTSAAMIYGRDALLREEHAKAAAYLLRGKMEEVSAALQVVDETRDDVWGRSFLNTAQVYEPVALDLETDRNRHDHVVWVTMSRDRVLKVDPLSFGRGYRVTVRASWTDPDLAGRRIRPGRHRELKFTTSVIVKQEL